MPQEPEDNLGVGHEQWFRGPSRREHLIAAGLFCGFGVFFLMLFALQRGWWFRWIVLILGIISIQHGLRHAINAIRKGPSDS